MHKHTHRAIHEFNIRCEKECVHCATAHTEINAVHRYCVLTIATATFPLLRIILSHLAVHS